MNADSPALHRTWLAVCALVLVALTFVAPLTGVVGGFVLVVALAPLGPSIPHRVGVVTLLWLSLSQYAYMVPWPTLAPPRQAVLWCVAALGVLVWAALSGSGTRPALPRPDAPAAALLAFALAIAWWYAPWRGDADHVLGRMLLGWDHSGHFVMVEQLRAPLPEAASAFAGYPRGYHALVASLMELGSGAPGPFAGELVAYLYACLTVMAASLLLVASFVLATPAFRTRGVALLPALGALVTIYLQLDDTSQVPYYGFGNFLEAACLAGAAMLLPLGWTRRNDPWRWFLLGSAAAGIVGTWPLLVAFCGAVPFVVWLGRRRRESGVLRRLFATMVWGFVPAALAVLTQPSPLQGVAGAGDRTTTWQALDRFLLLDGAIRTNSKDWPLVFALAGLVAPLAVGLVARRTGWKAGVRQWLWLPPAVALAMSACMIGYEVARVGDPRYYGVKVLCATTVAAGGVGIAASATLADRLLRARSAPRVGTWIVAGLATVGLLVCAGTPVPVPVLRPSPGGSVRADLASAGPDLRRPIAEAVRGACVVIGAHPRGEYYLLMSGIDREDHVRANVWIIGCGRNWDSDQSAALRTLLPDRREAGGKTPVDVATETRHILALRPNAVVVVGRPGEMAARSAVPFTDQSRILTY